MLLHTKYRGFKFIFATQSNKFTKNTNSCIDFFSKYNYISLHRISLITPPKLAVSVPKANTYIGCNPYSIPFYSGLW
jgi:hypothetical protein